VSEESIFRTIRFIVIVGLFLILISGCAEPRVMPSCELGTPECEAAWDDWNDYEDRIERKRKLDAYADHIAAVATAVNLTIQSGGSMFTFIFSLVSIALFVLPTAVIVVGIQDESDPDIDDIQSVTLLYGASALWAIAAVLA
jgi:hypothetical protein